MIKQKPLHYYRISLLQVQEIDTLYIFVRYNFLAMSLGVNYNLENMNITHQIFVYLPPIYLRNP